MAVHKRRNVKQRGIESLACEKNRILKSPSGTTKPAFEVSKRISPDCLVRSRDAKASVARLVISRGHLFDLRGMDLVTHLP